MGRLFCSEFLQKIFFVLFFDSSQARLVLDRPGMQNYPRGLVQSFWGQKVVPGPPLGPQGHPKPPLGALGGERAGHWPEINIFGRGGPRARKSLKLEKYLGGPKKQVSCSWNPPKLSQIVTKRYDSGHSAATRISEILPRGSGITESLNPSAWEAPKSMKSINGTTATILGPPDF